MQVKTRHGLKNPFDELATKYDQWFDTPRGKAIFAAEVACLKMLMGKMGENWLEVGVGSGRFAMALGVSEGVDPSSPMLEMAGRRGILIRKGCGEKLPYPDYVFDGVFMATTLCFLSDPGKAFIESVRVLKNNGCLVLGFVPLDSPWGKSYLRKGREGHSFYSSARFYIRDQVLDMAASAGFVFDSAASCLFSPPEDFSVDSEVQQGIIKSAGFVAMKFIIQPAKD